MKTSKIKNFFINFNVKNFLLIFLSYGKKFIWVHTIATQKMKVHVEGLKVTAFFFASRCRKYKANHYWINQARHIRSTSALCEYDILCKDVTVNLIAHNLCYLNRGDQGSCSSCVCRKCKRGRREMGEEGRRPSKGRRCPLRDRNGQGKHLGRFLFLSLVKTILQLCKACFIIAYKCSCKCL